jgi:hypothetical protein
MPRQFAPELEFSGDALAVNEYLNIVRSRSLLKR